MSAVSPFLFCLEAEAPALSSVRTTAAQYQTLRKLAADAKTSVDACRAQLGLRRPVEIDGLADRAEAEPAGARVLEHWEAQVEAEEALRLLAELRPLLDVIVRCGG